MKARLCWIMVAGALLVAGCGETTGVTSEFQGEYTAVEVDGSALPAEWSPGMVLTGALMALGTAPENFAILYELEPVGGDSVSVCTVQGEWKQTDSVLTVVGTPTVEGSGCTAQVTLTPVEGAILVETPAVEGGSLHELRFELRQVATLKAEPNALLFTALQQTQAIYVDFTDQAGVPFDVRTDLTLALEGEPVVELLTATPDSLVLVSVFPGTAQLILAAGTLADTVGITVTD